MPSRPAIIDADGHILERDSDIRKYLEPPWNRRATPLWAPSDQPWDTDLFGKRAKPEGYTRELNPEQQVETWLRVMDREGIDTAFCFPTSCGKLAYLQETAFAAR